MAATDYDAAKAKADAAAAKIQQLCTDNGYPDIKSCIGQDLPPLPEPPAAEQPAQPAEQSAAPAEQPAAEQPAAPAEQPAAPAEQPATEQPAEAGPESVPSDANAPNPQQAALDQLNTAAELYNVGIGQLQNGDPAGQSTIDAANKQFADLCAALGTNDVAQCLAQNGITLPPVPELAAPAQPAQPPIADLPGANEDVTPVAVEVLPETVKPEEAAPVLDSSKDVKTDEAKGEAPPPQAPPPAEPAGPPPADDKAAQADIAPVKVESLAKVEGEQIQPNALPPLEVPQNVTIINNVTNVTNTTNVTNNTTTVNNTTNNNTTNNNGGGGQGGGGKPGGNGPGKPGGNPPPGGNNYTNSGYIFQIGVNLVISNPAQDFDRIRDSDEDEVYYQRLPGGRVKETIERPNGVQIVTIRDKWGNVLKRSRIMPDGREYILAYYDEDNYDDEDYFNNWRDPGDDLPPLHLNIPIRDYVLDADYADESDVEDFFGEPPVERVKKIYTIEDVKRSARLRDSVRRIEVGSLTFDSGAATISRSQVGALSKVANAMLKLLDKNPGEVFLIEGHTDAVGSDQANLILSDARAATVARILTDFYDVPPENLVTQGYGERYLKVKTLAAEPLNRRVVLKRITPLVTVANNN
jgi:outer membrane protein OmpA-like peptidoglycan-associated protein